MGEIPRQEEPEQEKMEGNMLDILLIRIPSKEEKQRVSYLEAHANDESFKANHSFPDILGKEKEVYNILREKLNDKLLIDLGGGKSSLERVLENNKGIQLKGYLNVDKFPSNFNLDKKTPQGFNFEEESINGKTKTYVEAGMLDFLQYIENHSIEAIALNGIDWEVIGSIEYQEEFAKEIKRVLSPGGIVFGYDSIAINDLLQD